MSDELYVVTVTYSPGPHLDRFLASLAHATERPVTVLMADNGSTDGAPEEAVERYPNARLLRMGGNLGYGSAINRAVAEYGLTSSTDFCPKLRMFMSCVSDRATSSLTVLMPSRLRQL